jgi:hypothetical protein
MIAVDWTPSTPAIVATWAGGVEGEPPLPGGRLVVEVVFGLAFGFEPDPPEQAPSSSAAASEMARRARPRRSMATGYLNRLGRFEPDGPPPLPCPNQYFVYDDGRLAGWVPPAELPSPRVELRPAGRYLAALHDRAPTLGLRFLITDVASGALPLSGPDVVVVCVKDELAVPPAYAGPVGAVFKSYGCDRPFPGWAAGGSLWAHAWTTGSEAAVQARRAVRLLDARRQAARVGRPPVMDIPLGCLVDPPAVLKPVAARGIDVAFMGSVATPPARPPGPARLRLAPAASVKSEARRRLVAELAAMAAEGRGVVHLGPTGSYFESQGRHAEFARTLADTKVLPCPRGNSLETYRLFEAFAFGCIPVLTDPLPPRRYYDGAPVVRVAGWSRLPALLDRLLADPGEMARLQASGQRWWRERAAPAMVAGEMLGRLGQLYGAGYLGQA